jgi:Sarcosine oxidase delta subunit
VLRTWGGIVDVCPDASPIISKTPVEGLYFNCGWGTGGFKATPGSGWVFAHTIAQDRPHKLNEPFAWIASSTAISSTSTAPPASRIEDRHPMMLIDCPFCGPRAELEFTCGGESHIARRPIRRR